MRGVTVSGSLEKRTILESNTGGAAALDYDRDGLVDVFITNGLPLEGSVAGAEPRPMLYRNDGGWRFDDVGAEVGLHGGRWGMGAAAVDYDGDGWTDLYLTNYGANALYRNDRGRFVDLAPHTGVDLDSWSTGAAFGDYDNDGDLDLYVASYLELDPDLEPAGKSLCNWRGVPVFCGPQGLSGARDVYLRNEGPQEGWLYSDATDEAGLGGHAYYGFSALASDLDGDGDLDLYVANDTRPNLYFRNEGGRFREMSLLNASALSEDGREQAGMGLAAGDYDGDGDFDLFVTNFSHDNNTLYANDGRGFFTDRSFSSGLGGASMMSLGWGTAFLDYDNDGREDLFVANGHVYPAVDDHDAGTRYAQTNQLFRGDGRGGFEDVSQVAGAGLQIRKSSRGSSVADLDNDGDLDVVVVNIDDRPTLLRNDGGNHYNWLAVELVGTGWNRQAIGARVTLTVDDRLQSKEVRSGTGYLSQDDMRLHFGLGRRTVADRITVRWPDGRTETTDEVPANQYVSLTQGQVADRARESSFAP